MAACGSAITEPRAESKKLERVEIVGQLFKPLFGFANSASSSHRFGFQIWKVSPAAMKEGLFIQLDLF